MEILLKELINPNTAILNDTQKSVLIMAHISPTEKLAFDATTKASNLSKARDSLARMGMVNASNNRMYLTDLGEEMIKHHNLTDETGELTDEARELLDQIKGVAKNFREDSPQTESFNFLASLL